jgi:hypothetical protein
MTAVPSELRSPRAKLVHLNLYLSTHGDATVGELQVELSMEKLALQASSGRSVNGGYVEP